MGPVSVSYEKVSREDGLILTIEAAISKNDDTFLEDLPTAEYWKWCESCASLVEGESPTNRII